MVDKQDSCHSRGPIYQYATVTKIGSHFWLKGHRKNSPRKSLQTFEKKLNLFVRRTKEIIIKGILSPNSKDVGVYVNSPIQTEPLEGCSRR
ncbi:hypothetical protein ElyMa_000167500 [Elysia marginata]|uniref:Uncharacterized protein n=1 Tax=Elysia marginata TaxID=1093978 RepID=A0AAV4EUW4_9GAST|nr:hypothetical protein ElyMa_000167500 [Elysia marginata]